MYEGKNVFGYDRIYSDIFGYIRLSSENIVYQMENRKPNPSIQLTLVIAMKRFLNLFRD